MSKACRILSIVVCAVCAIGVVAVGVYYFCFSLRAKNTLSVSIENISLTVGQSSEIEFKVSKSDAVVTFSVTDSEVVSLSDNKVTGLKVGSTFLRANAECDGDSAYSVAKITVVASSTGSEIEHYDYTIEVLTMDKEPVGDHLDYTEPIMLNINLMRNGVAYNVDLDVTATDGIEITPSFGCYLIVANKSGSINISRSSLGVSRTIYIEVK